MYAIENESVWTAASANAAVRHASVQNGKSISPAALMHIARNAPGKLHSWGIRRLVNAAEPAPPLYQNTVQGLIEPIGDVAKIQWAFVDLALADAQAQAVARIEAREVRAYDAPIELVGHLFFFDANYRALLGSIGTSLAAGNTYTNRRLRAYNIKQSRWRHVSVDAANFQALTAAIAAQDQAIGDNANTLIAAVDSAANVAALRAIDIDSGWPS
ncbi:MAG: hypothetical protein Unbinned4026contig1001_15 [Prokaryotic dsDNA virus sp.]|nr:MAG: hypothetical protein Unbinned4026contig1001_15 [Prokaryotic dsDNA virus sp.]|tara:strand:- start:1474 stop:2118 length:645 start_codon:yes stop_codon:yes gene_type:complete